MSSSRVEGNFSRDNSMGNVSAASGSQRPRRGRNNTNNRSTPRNSASSGTGSERRSATFFRTFFAQRNTDYRSEATHYSPATTTPRTPAVRRPSSGRSSPILDGSELDESTANCSRCTWLQPSPRFLHGLSVIIKSPLWKIIIAFNTVLLLFGSEFQELFIPPTGDIVMDILFFIALGVFTADIIMRCYLEPNYASLPTCHPNQQNSAWGRCSMGSFLFWCDFVSTLTLLYNISFINAHTFQAKTIDITLNVIGIPVSSAYCSALFSLVSHWPSTSLFAPSLLDWRSK